MWWGSGLRSVVSITPTGARYSRCHEGINTCRASIWMQAISAGVLGAAGESSKEFGATGLLRAMTKEDDGTWCWLDDCRVGGAIGKQLTIMDVEGC